MILDAYRAAYRWLGPRYLRTALFLQNQTALLLVLGGIGLLTVYQPLGEDFWRILLVAEALTFVENIVAWIWIRRLLEPVGPWLDGDRSERAVTTAWHALAELPRRFTRQWKFVPLVFTVVPVCAFATWQLELEAFSFLFLFAGALVVLGYGLFLRYFAIELTVRPVIEEVARDLPATHRPARGVSLRTRLLLALPLLNVITGVIVAGLSTSGTASLEDLGLDVAVAVLVAFTLSLELTILLARSIVDPIAELEQATRRVAAGDLDVRVPVASADETGQLARSFNEALEGLRERARLQEAFGAYVDPDVAQRVLEQGVSLEGEDVEVSIVFVDIRDFTALAERSSARELVGYLNDFFELVVPELARHGGHANKFVGDGVLGVFGAPDRLADHADRAVAAAISIATLVEERWSGRMEIGIGVNSGPVVAGTVGGGGRVDFTVIGDPVNTAARVEKATRESGDTLLVTAATRALLRHDRFEWLERPGIDLRGKSDPVALYAPVRPAAAARPPGAAARRARA